MELMIGVATLFVAVVAQDARGGPAVAAGELVQRACADSSVRGVEAVEELGCLPRDLALPALARVRECRANDIRFLRAACSAEAMAICRGAIDSDALACHRVVATWARSRVECRSAAFAALLKLADAGTAVTDEAFRQALAAFPEGGRSHDDMELRDVASLRRSFTVRGEEGLAEALRDERPWVVSWAIELMPTRGPQQAAQVLVPFVEGIEEGYRAIPENSGVFEEEERAYASRWGETYELALQALSVAGGTGKRGDGTAIRGLLFGSTSCRGLFIRRPCESAAGDEPEVPFR